MMMGGRRKIRLETRPRWTWICEALRTVLPAVCAFVVGASLSWSNPANRELLRRLDGLPLSFVENVGQSDPAVAYYASRPGLQAYFTKTAVTLRVIQGEGEEAMACILRMELAGASAKTAIEPVRLGGGVVSYFKGSCDQWKTGIRMADEIAYRQPWPGVDVHYRGREGRIEAVYVVAPGADPASIRVRYVGQDALKLDETGNLLIETPIGEIQISAPVLYQEIAGTRLPVGGRYILAAEDTVALQVAAYDRAHPLTIDPTIAYAGFIGGLSSDSATSIAVDSTGAAYVTGYTVSTEATFPTTVGPDLTYNGDTNDAFVVKISASGTSLVYAGYIGGSGLDRATGICVDSAGAAYVTGHTYSTGATFPVAVGPDLTQNGNADAFLAKVNPAGTGLVYAGYIGGSLYDDARAIAVDGSGAAYVTGYTGSSAATFPVAVGPDLTSNGTYDAFVAKVNPSGTALVYAGYIGGSGADYAFGIAVDGAGAAYVTGDTSSTEATFPVTVGPDLTSNGNYDAFVAKLSSSGTALVYAGYVGGSGDDYGVDVAVDTAGAAYLVGTTDSTEATFPVLGGPDLTSNGLKDAFITKVSTSGATLVYSGYIGGIGTEIGEAIAVDGTGAAYVAGSTSSTEATFPVTVGPDLTWNGSKDSFVAKISGDAPAITSVKSRKAKPGSPAKIRGSGFSADAKKNVAYFGAYKAKIKKATATLLKVTIPTKSKKGAVDVYVLANGVSSNKVEFTVK